jgi:hypothetical protein
MQGNNVPIELSPDSDAYKEVYYQLEMSLNGKTPFSAVQILKVENPNLAVQFSRK